jgi:hypothetical protein
LTYSSPLVGSVVVGSVVVGEVVPMDEFSAGADG